MPPTLRLPRVARWLLKLVPLGDRREDIESDLGELYAERTQRHSASYAARRFIVDVLSLAAPRPSLSGVLQDMRHALRLFQRHAVVVSATVAGLGLAIAMCTTVFSLLNAEVFRPFEMDDPATVVRVQRLYERGHSTSWPYSAFVALQSGSSAGSVQAFLDDTVRLNVSAESAAKPEAIAFVSGGYLSTLGGRAIAGRTLDASDDRQGATPVVVISHAFWMRHFGGDAGVIGRPLSLSSGAATVVGVLRPKFSGPVENPPSLWAPFATYGALYGGAAISATSQIQVNVIARTAPESSVAAAQDALTSIAAGLPPAALDGSAAAPQKTTGVQLTSAASRIEGSDAAVTYAIIAVIFIVLSLVLAVACANVANLLLAGASSRAREFGVRVAMGASRQRLLRQLLSESVVLGAAAGVLGFFLSLWMVPLLTRIADPSTVEPIAPDLNVMLFTTVISLMSGLGAGLAPARYGARGDVSGILKAQSLQTGASPTASRLRRGFIAFQAAASMLLLVTAALFLRAALHITHTSLGFDANRLVTVTLAFDRASSDQPAGDQTRAESYFRVATERIRALPSVEQVSLALYPPFGGAVAVTNLSRNGSEYLIFDNRTDAAYFKTTGLRIVRGRGYTPEEVAGHAPVVVVSESLVRDFLAGAEPIGASLAPMTADHRTGVTIIGVVADAMVSHLRGGGSGTTYRPIEPLTLTDARLVIRSADPDHLARNVESTLAAVDPHVRATVSVMRENVDRVMNEPKLIAGLSGAVALLALVLSVMGIFGVTSFVIAQRTQEVSVRMAIGASAGDVVRMLIRQNAGPVMSGLATGLALALLVSRVLIGALSGISPYDAIAIVPAVIILAGTALAAVVAPALRAAKADPASVLRQ